MAAAPAVSREGVLPKNFFLKGFMMLDDRGMEMIIRGGKKLKRRMKRDHRRDAGDINAETGQGSREGTRHKVKDNVTRALAVKLGVLPQ
jgi:hypothetical protein